MPKRSRSGVRQQAEAGGGRHQREFRQVDLHRASGRPFPDDEVELEIFHRRIEDFLDGRIEAMDLVDEEHVALLEIGEQGSEIAGLGDNRARRRAEIDAELFGHDLRQRRLAEAGRTDEEHMVQRFAAVFRRLDEDLEIGARLRLAGELVQRLRAQRRYRDLRPAFPAISGGRDSLMSKVPFQVWFVAAWASNVLVVTQPASRLRRAMKTSANSRIRPHHDCERLLDYIFHLQG